MYNLESLPLIHVWLDADQLASTARILMAGYKVPAIGVVDGNRKLIGWVTAIELAAAKDDAKIRDILVEAPSTLAAELSVRDAAGELIRKEADFLPVAKDERFLGIVTSRSLLGKLRESYDPMTDLPWSDALREWGTSKLERKAEIAILFIDLNGFGQFNKQYGHVIGDRVIKKVASHLQSKIDPALDILVRYGGDEFAIGTIRERHDAEGLIENIQGDGRGLVIEDVDTRITFTIGIYGGRRTKVRNEVHGPSNLDDLVNLASRDCLAKKEGHSQLISNAVVETKPSPTQEEETEVSEQVSNSIPESQPAQTEPIAQSVEGAQSAPTATSVITRGPVIETIQADDEPNSLTYVVIRSEEKLYVGVSPKMGHSRVESIAIATGKALEKAFPDTKVTVDSVNVERAGSTELATTKVRTVRDNLERDITAQAEANGDLDETIGLAIISAFLAE